MRSDFVGDRNWVSSAPTAKVDVVLPDVISKYLATGDASALQSALTDLLTLDGARESLRPTSRISSTRTRFSKSAT